MSWQLQIGVSAVISVLIIWLQHWFPWRFLLGHDLPRLGAYTLGIFALALPYSVLLLLWGVDDLIYRILLALWLLIAACGMATVGAHALDHIMERLNLANELEELLDIKESHGKSTNIS